MNERTSALYKLRIRPRGIPLANRLDLVEPGAVRGDELPVRAARVTDL